MPFLPALLTPLQQGLHVALPTTPLTAWQGEPPLALQWLLGGGIVLEIVLLFVLALCVVRLNQWQERLEALKADLPKQWQSLQKLVRQQRRTVEALPPHWPLLKWVLNTFGLRLPAWSYGLLNKWLAS